MPHEIVSTNQLHRLVKLPMDTGEAATPEEAEQILRRYQLGIQVGVELAASPAYQAALLTIVNTGRRAFLGGVSVAGDLDIPLNIPWKACTTLGEAVRDLQGRLVPELSPTIPKIYLSAKPMPSDTAGFAVRPVIRNWSGGVIPAEDTLDIDLQEACTPAGVAAGALAVSEAFQFVRGDNALCGRRTIGLNLWSPKDSIHWLTVEPAPALRVLPSKLWLTGLGHLGQAFLWTLGLLPYGSAEPLRLVLQDIDELEDANDSTSLLTHRGLVGLRKTRAMAAWCEQRGFATNLIERAFAADFRINDSEPQLAFCGVDNAEARRALEGVGFKQVIEAGLGKGVGEYLSFQLHSFPASRHAESYWHQSASDAGLEDLVQMPAYQALQAKGLDRCGLAQLAGRSVGASFVGAVTSALAIAEVLRLVHGEAPDEVIDGDLRATKILGTVLTNQTRMEPYNPGIIRLRALGS